MVMQLAFIFSGLIFGQFAFAQKPAKEDLGEVISRPVDKAYEEGWTKVKQFSKKDIKKVCKTYEGKFIGYYHHLYKIEGCKRRKVTKDKALMSRHLGLKVHLVEPNVIAMIPQGRPLDSMEKSHRRSCKDIEGRYVTFTFTGIYLVKNCKLREFPDWETFQAHRKKNDTMRKPVLALKANEFFSFRKGRRLGSKIDKAFSKVLTGEAGVDVLPIDEACSGVEGKDVYYYSKIYRIQKCRKRPYVPEVFIKKKNGEVKLIELTSSQWLSIPDGEPMMKN